MLLYKNPLRVNRKHLGGLMILTVFSIICVAFSMTGNDDFDVARREILLRRIGHELLLQSGDSSSRVLPVKKLANNEYRISFEKAFSFSPDSLVQTTKRLLANDPLGTDYVVTVLNCADNSVVYGYAIAKKGKDDIVACLGRIQPVACYTINIKFGPTGIISAKNGYLLGGLALVTLVGFILLRSPKRGPVVPENGSAVVEDHPALSAISSATPFMLGAMLFDSEARKLTINGTTIDLTKTETRVLSIFAASPNEEIERSGLQKEIWEDEGVIVGRSLDVFISKLRKKIEGDPTARITVIRGKGYKLEVDA